MKVKTTILAPLDDSGGVVASHRLNCEWTFYVTPRGAVYAGQVLPRNKTPHHRMTRPGEWAMDPHAAVAIEETLRILDLDMAPAVGWAVDAGDLFVLTIAAERVRATLYRPNGEQVSIWDVLPEPVTSVS